MLNKKIRQSGGKAWQREDREDRTIAYKDWINSQNSNGFWLDADAIKWRLVDGEYQPFMITELTASSKDTIPQKAYLDAIENRIFERDKQGIVLSKLGELLNVPVFWVLFPYSFPRVRWIYVLDVSDRVWTLFSPESWIDFIKRY